MSCHNEPPRKIPPQLMPTPLKWMLPVLLGLVAVLLLFEHRMHLGAILPWLLLAGCAVMHLFMHRGHGAHNHAGHTDERQRSNHGAEADK